MASPFHYTHAVVGGIPQSLVAEALRMEDLGAVDLAAAEAEHERYVATLRSLGLQVRICLKTKSSLILMI